MKGFNTLLAFLSLSIYTPNSESSYGSTLKLYYFPGVYAAEMGGPSYNDINRKNPVDPTRTVRRLYPYLYCSRTPSLLISLRIVHYGNFNTFPGCSMLIAIRQRFLSHFCFGRHPLGRSNLSDEYLCKYVQLHPGLIPPLSHDIRVRKISYRLKIKIPL